MGLLVRRVVQAAAAAAAAARVHGEGGCGRERLQLAEAGLGVDRAAAGADGHNDRARLLSRLGVLAADEASAGAGRRVEWNACENRSARAARLEAVAFVVRRERRSAVRWVCDDGRCSGLLALGEAGLAVA